jgi:hypothetical protein
MLKIFEAGFKEKEINDFLANNLWVQYQMNADGKGGLYIFYHSKEITGKSKIDILEQLKKAVDSAENTILIHKIDKIQNESALDHVSEVLKGLKPNQKEQWDAQQKRKQELERQIKMHDDTIKTTLEDIAAIKKGGAKLLNE